MHGERSAPSWWKVGCRHLSVMRHRHQTRGKEESRRSRGMPLDHHTRCEQIHLMLSWRTPRLTPPPTRAHTHPHTQSRAPCRRMGKQPSFLVQLEDRNGGGSASGVAATIIGTDQHIPYDCAMHRQPTARKHRRPFRGDGEGRGSGRG
jgi:hypothetical protein